MTPEEFGTAVINKRSYFIDLARRYHVTDPDEIVDQAIEYVLVNGHVEKFDPELSSLETFVGGAVISRAIDDHRREERHREYVDHTLETMGGESEREFEKAESRVDLDLALEKMDRSQASLIRLHHIEGYTAREIADRTGLTEKAVERRLDRARAQLKTLLTG